MCCMGTDDKPQDTNLFNVPVKVNGKGKWRCLLYTNSIEFRTPRALMIVPVPNKPGNRELYLVGVEGTKQLRKRIKAALRPRRTRGGSRSSAPAMDDGDDFHYAPVVTVGNFKCSVVFSAEELTTHIDWSKFTVPDDLKLRLSVLHDTSLMPPHAAFVVAEAEEPRMSKSRFFEAKQGFGIVYPTSDVFFPTCHEGNDTGIHYFDVSCYSLGTHAPSFPGISDSTHSDFRVAADDAAFTDVVSARDTRDCVIQLDASAVKCVSVVSLHGLLRNQNLFSGKRVLPPVLAPPPSSTKSCKCSIQ